MRYRNERRFNKQRDNDENIKRVCRSKIVCGQIELANGILKAVNYIEGDNIPVAYDAEKVLEEMKND